MQTRLRSLLGQTVRLTGRLGTLPLRVIVGLLGKHRLRNMIMLAFGLMAAFAVPAAADPGDGGILLSIFDLSDDNGIRISQYQLALKPSGVWNELLTFFLRCGWAIFSWGIGAIGWFAGWTFGLPWLSMVTNALHGFATLLNSNFIGPVGVVGLMCAIAGLVAMVRFRSGGTGSAATEVVIALIFAVVAGLMATNPVLNITDGPVKEAQRAALVAGNMITSSKLTDSDVGGALPKSEVDPGRILVTSVVRPMHSAINYGVDIDHNKCRATYNKTLKAGPYEDASKDQFDAMNACDSRLGDYAKNPTFEQLIAMGIALQELGSVALLVGVFGIVVNAAAIMVVWSAFSMFYQAILAIASSEARASVLEAAAKTCMNLILLVISYFLLAGSLRVIKEALTDQQTSLPIRVMSFNIFTVIGAAGLIYLFVRHQRMAKRLAESASEKMKAPAKQPSRIGTAVETQLARQATRMGTQGAMGLARGTLAAGAGAATVGTRSVRLLGKAAIAGGSAATGGALTAAAKVHSGVMAARRAQAATRMVPKIRTQETVDAGQHVQRTGSPRKQAPTATDAPAKDPFTTGIPVSTAKTVGKPDSRAKTKRTAPIQVKGPARPAESDPSRSDLSNTAATRRRGSTIPAAGVKITKASAHRPGQGDRTSRETRQPATAARATPAVDTDGRPLGFQPAANSPTNTDPRATPSTTGQGGGQNRGPGRDDKSGKRNHRSAAAQRLEQRQQSRNRAARQTAARRNAAIANQMNRRRRGAA